VKKGNTSACMSKLDARLSAVEEAVADILSAEKEPRIAFENALSQYIAAQEKFLSEMDAKIAELMMAPDATDRSLVVHEPNTGKSLVVYRPQDFTAYEWAGLALLVLVSAYVGRRVESYQ
jgi:hypothetical protein